MITKFEIKKIETKYLNQVRGGWCVSGNSGTGKKDFVDDCGWTHYEDCTEKADGDCE